MRTKKALWITVAVAVILLIMGAVVIAKPSLAKGVPEGISFNGSSLAGLTPEEAKNKITEYMSYFNNRTIELTVSDETMTITMKDIDLKIEGEEEALIQLEEAIPYGNVFQRYKQEKDLEKEPVDIKASISYNEEKLNTIVTDLVEKHKVAVQEPTYKKTSSGFVTTTGATGIDFNIAKIISDLNTYLSSEMPENGEKDVFQYTAEALTVEPNIPVGAYDDLNANVLGTFTTLFNAGDVDRTTNLEVACGKINGIVILPDQVASLLDILSPISYEAGYKDAIAIVGGKHVPDLGGGLCQVATTLYNALLRSEVEIVHRRNHSHISTYVDYAMDAMIYPGGNDFKFKNNLDHPIYIEAGISRNGTNSPITITIYGTEYRAANRTIEFYHKTLVEEFIEPLYVVNRYNPSNAPAGTETIPRRLTRTVTDAYPKVVAECWKRILVDGKVVDEVKINTSSYQAQAGIINASWDLTILYWLQMDENGDHAALYELKDGRNWDPSTETTLDLSKVTIIPWVGQDLNEDGSKVEPKTEAPETSTTKAPETEAPKTEAPKTEAPKTEAPETEAPKTEPPETEAPETSVADSISESASE